MAAGCPFDLWKQAVAKLRFLPGAKYAEGQKTRKRLNYRLTESLYAIAKGISLEQQ